MRQYCRPSPTIYSLASLAISVAICPVPAALAAGAVPNPAVTPIAYDAGSKQHPFASSSLNLPATGYMESEYQMSGTANVYVEDGNWGSNGKWQIKVAQADVPYVTRMLVRRPSNPAKFNGTVVVEWYNVSGQVDADALWSQGHTGLLRDGYAWVGVSAQSAGVGTLKSWDSERYGAFNLGDDSLSYDIFSQAAQALRSQTGLLLGQLPLRNIIGAGESQSAARLFTYVNAFQAPATQVYDGILIYSRGSSGAPIGSGGLITQGAAYIRADNAIKVMQLETEQDAGQLGFSLAQQADTEHLRTWETAGASHFDAYGNENLLPQYQRDLPTVAALATSGCKNPTNALPFQYIVNAAIAAFTRWIETDQAPPSAPLIKFSSDGKIVRDAYGNAKGGIRLPQMEAPTAVNGYQNSAGNGNVLINTFFCGAFGSSSPFSSATLHRLYPTHEDYLSKFTTAAQAALDAGFILQPDYDETVRNAKVANVPD